MDPNRGIKTIQQRHDSIAIKRDQQAVLGVIPAGAFKEDT
jgi:hypothetical protein